VVSGWLLVFSFGEAKRGAEDGSIASYYAGLRGLDCESGGKTAALHITPYVG